MLPPIRHEANAHEAQDHHGPGGGFGDGGNGERPDTKAKSGTGFKNVITGDSTYGERRTVTEDMIITECRRNRHTISIEVNNADPAFEARSDWKQKIVASANS